jgi:hypothetical protein
MENKDMMRNFTIGDIVVSDIFKTEKGLPYTIKITNLDGDLNVVHFIHNGEESYIGTQSLRYATKFEKIFGPIYDFFIK